MTFASPLAIWWLAMAIPVAGLFFFKVRPTELVVPSLALWEPLRRAHEPHGYGTRFGRWPMFLIQLLIVVLLAMTLLDPQLVSARHGVIIVLDDSATMQTRDKAGRTRFELAKSAALDRIRGAGPNGVPAVILAGQQVLVAAKPAADRQSPETVIGRLAPRDVNADLVRAIRLASMIAVDSHAGDIVVYSDKPETVVDRKVAVEWVRIGQPQPNIGIVGLRTSPSGRELIATIHQKELEGVSATIRLVSDDRELDRRQFTCVGNTFEITLAGPTKNGQAFEVRCEPRDALPLDNVFRGVWTMPKLARVLLVTRGCYQLHAALLDPSLEIETIPPEQWNGSQTADLVVFDTPELSNLNITEGRFIVFGGSDPFGLASSISPQVDQRPVQWSPDHPVLKDVDLISWQIRRTANFGLSARVQAIATGVDAPLVLESRKSLVQPEGGEKSLSVIFVNFNVRDGNLKSTFPIFVWNAVQHSLGRLDFGAALAFSTGGPVRLPRQARGRVVVTDPRGKLCDVVVGQQETLLLQPHHAGFYYLNETEKLNAIALNWVTDGSEVRHAKPGNEKPWPAPSHAALDSWLNPLWSRILIFAAGIIIVEMILFHFNVLRLG